MVNTKGLCGWALLLKDPPKRSAVWTTPGPSEAATHHPGVIWPLPAAPSATQHQQPSPQRGISIHFLSKAAPISLAGTNSHFLSRHWHPSPQQALAAISSEGCWHPSPQRGTGIHFFSKAAPITLAGTWGHLLSGHWQPSPQQGHWHPFPQRGSAHLLSKHQKPSP